MIAGSFLGLFFIPLFFVVVERVFTRRGREPAAAGGAPDSAGSESAKP
jgi:multidrug efflux pump